MTNRLRAKTALVTGSTGGIGRAIATAYAAEGAHVLVSGRRERLGREVVDEIRRTGGSADFVAGDLAAEPAEFALRALEMADHAIDILVNNAAHLTFATPTSGVTGEVIDAALAVNVRGPFLLTGIIAPAMVQRGGGVILNVGSTNGFMGLAGSALYSLTKAANHSVTKSWAAEYGRFGVRVNAIAPGPSETEGNVAEPGRVSELVTMTASGRMSRLDEQASAAVFLASDEAENIQGVILPVDGGLSAVSRVWAP